ncbi:MAG: hemerythrin domain-containing protein [Magnetococcales bacterium]|nr:hemerythrin domain-containing protein [Magnetococcales bacterium]
MTFDHRRCDDLYVQMEQAADAGDHPQTQQLLADFTTGMQHHFAMEETVFFPAFEQQTGMRQGPTTVMRMEHDQIRGILKQMRQSLDSNNLAAVLRASSTLLMLMQQHNIKEEQMLYAMGDAHLADETDQLVRQMQAVQLVI